MASAFLQHKPCDVSVSDFVSQCVCTYSNVLLLFIAVFINVSFLSYIVIYISNTVDTKNSYTVSRSMHFIDVISFVPICPLKYIRG